MSEEPNEPEQHPGSESAPSPAANPLSYEAPRDRLLRDPPANVLGASIAAMLGFAISAGGVLFWSAFLFVGLNGLGLERTASGAPAPRSPPRAVDRVTGLIYLLGFIGLAWATFRYKRKSDKDLSLRRWLALGFLVGLGLASLLEGVCFVAQ